MIIWTGRETNGRRVGTISAKNMHDLFDKLASWIPPHSNVPDYFDRDLMVEFLSKENSDIAELNKKIEDANSEGEYEIADKLFDEETDKIYEEADKLSDSKVEELIEFAGTAFRDEFTIVDETVNDDDEE